MPLPRPALTSSVSHGPLAGAWWPRCGALELELPSLVAALGYHGARHRGRRPMVRPTAQGDGARPSDHRGPDGFRG
ncbi:DUF5994 family protein, partial [Streptomyces sp. NPDC002766]|uniref:DUF5994 family protein n=1 Tax=Streptomyces sp. NPDC002766 TaxID=3154429 RepID=UPI003325B373